MIKPLLLGVLFILTYHTSLAHGPLPLMSIEIDIASKPALQRGARMFMNYCAGCHSLRYLRYSRMAKDIGITRYNGQVNTDLLMQNLVFTDAKPDDPILTNMPPKDAMQWFGVVPPDLTLTARERGPDWIYTYLKSFYKDPKRPFGTNNLLVPDVAMPNVLENLQGEVKLTHTGLVLIKSGLMDNAQFDATLKDLVTFLVYTSEPAQLVRYKIGAWVMVFMFILLIFSYMLKQFYWRKIH